MARLIIVASTTCLMLALIGSTSLQAQWAQAPIPICSNPFDQRGPQVVSDGASGAIIIWTDYRNGNADIYAQRIDANGHALWAQDGIPVCSMPTEQELPQVVSSAYGGAIIVWQERRSYYQGIYAQRINLDGSMAWGGGGLSISEHPLDAYEPKICTDNSGGAIITWFGYRDHKAILAQKVDASGNVKWATNGKCVCCDVTFHQQYPLIAPDGNGGALIGWNSLQDGAFKCGQRIDANGINQWYFTGSMVCFCRIPNWAFFLQAPRLVTDGGNGGFAAWHDERENGSIYVQHIGNNGAVLWVVGGIPIATNIGGAEPPVVISRESQSAVVAWHNENEGSSFIQKIDAGGGLSWGPNGIELSISNPYHIALDGDGSSIVVGCGIQSISSTGSTNWINGFCIPSSAAPSVAGDGNGGVLVAWQGGQDIYVQRIDANGNIPVATLVRDYRAYAANEGILIEWHMSMEQPDIIMLVERAEDPQRTFRHMPSDAITRNGTLYSFADVHCEAGRSYWYRVACFDNAYQRILFEVGPLKSPSIVTALHQNHPNPFNPVTVISFTLQEEMAVQLSIYNLAGMLVKTILDESMTAGIHETCWDGTDASGKQLDSGVYFYRLRAGKESISRKLILLR